jgi:hypothetical protein
MPPQINWCNARRRILCRTGQQRAARRLPGVDPEAVDVSPVEVNEKEPLSITDNGSGKSGRLDLN